MIQMWKCYWSKVCKISLKQYLETHKERDKEQAI